MVLRDRHDKISPDSVQQRGESHVARDLATAPTCAPAQSPDVVNVMASVQTAVHNFVVVDFRSLGFMHQEYNLGLLRYLLLRYPQTAIHLLGHPGYASGIEEAIADQRLRAHKLNVLTRHRFNALERPETFLRSARAVWLTLRMATRIRAERIYVLGSDSFLVYFFRKFNIAGRFQVRHLFHGDIAAHFLGWQPRNPITRYFRLPRQMSLGGGNRSDFVFLEETIVTSVRARVSSLGSPCSVFPHPMPRQDLRPACGVARRSGPVRIAFTGVARIDKGFEIVLEICRQIVPERVEMLAVGKRGSEYQGVVMQGLSQGPFDEAISIHDYHRLLADADYVILPADPQIYAFVGSSSFHDAVFHGKPVLGLRSDYLSLLEARFGAFGILFDRAEALRDCILNWQDPPAASYEMWKQNMERLRRSREPDQLAVHCDF